MVGERAEDVQWRSVRGPEPAFVEQFLHLFAEVGDRCNSRGVHAAILSRRQNGFVTEALCQFCDVVNGALAAREVLRDDIVVAFLDRSPVFKGHVLVAPLQHTVTLVDLDPDLVGPFFERVQRIAARMPVALDCDGTFVAINNVVSQSVAHLHVHVVPRRRKDGLRGFFWPRVRYESDAEADDFALRLREALAI
ncbi:MAG: HIT family protein [Ilumatobacteraceae bacterium]|nr:HIT family protein [Ilumatobacteraceae bacterium]